MTLADRSHHRLHRSLGLRQVDAAAGAQSNVCAVPGSARRGRGADRTARTSSDPSVDVAELRYRVGMVFQKADAVSDVGVRQRRLRAAAGRRGARARTARTRVEVRAARRGDVGRGQGQAAMPTAAASPAASSSGCASRGAIAVQPEVLLLDEPTAALDPISTLRVEETLQALREKYCIVVVTHNLQQAARVSNVTGFMYLGELVGDRPVRAKCSPPRRTARPTTTSPGGSVEARAECTRGPIRGIRRRRVQSAGGARLACTTR